ncbi:MAG: D-alanyl-D-alanine carboxypeptidase family protein [Clostridia bacterium]|nr:D-alanyl-D-alanine carboxypeptidase family protein [Clostridia bacterium]
MNKRAIIFIVVIMSVFMNITKPVLSEPTDNTVEQTTADQASDNVENSDEPAEPEIDLSLPAPHAEAVFLTDLKSDKVLYERNSDERLYPASTTKIMTAILTLENADLTQTVTAQSEAIAPITNKHSHMGILVGEELTVEQLLYGLLVYSANDAANVLAVHIAGSIDTFAQMMNDKAAELGATGTHFVNPHGFHDDNHYTTAHDLAVMAKYAMQNEKFREIVKTDMYIIEPTNKYHETRYLSNTNHLVSRKRQANYFYSKAIGIKTGYTDEAGSCLVAAAEDGDTQLLSVVMKCRNSSLPNSAYSFCESKDLLEYGFENFKYITIASDKDIVKDSKVYEAKKNARVALTPQNDVSSLLPVTIDKEKDIEPVFVLNEKIAAPIAKGDVLGTVSYKYQGEVVGTANLVAANDVEKDMITASIHLVIKIITNPIFIIIAVIILFLYFYTKRKRRINRRKRRSRMTYVKDDNKRIR